MSCCDNSTFTIKNNSSIGWTVTDISTDEKFSGIKVGELVPVDQELSGTASSSSGSGGHAVGNLCLTSGKVKLKLDYAFKPVGDGDCPCTASVIQTPIKAGAYIANAKFSQGKKEGEAFVKWVIEDND